MTSAKPNGALAAALAGFIALAMGAGGASGCVRVKPYQREDLSRRTMISDREPGEARFDGHARASREGAEGGDGAAGGGCGCN
jgi:hypothetical protein